jgi:DNA-binding GntR family transcriptional regulator
MSTSALPIHQPEAATARSLADQAYYRIRELIVSLELPPGSPISERELMERLGLGRTPVREALRALARECLVDVYPRRGMFVSGVDVGDLAGLSEVRAALESDAARLAAERATEGDRAAIAALLGELNGVDGKLDERTLIDLDQRIHRHVYRCTHNPFLEATLDEYYVLTLRIWFLALDRVARLEDAVGEHRELLEAIRDGDPDRAGEAMRRHVTGFEQAIRRVL